MFWKKTKSETDVISHESGDQRDTYRYVFRTGLGPEINFKGKTIKILNISAGGIAFKNNGFEIFESGPIQFAPDIPNYTGDTSFSANLRILKTDQDNICHCIFENCSLEQYELIHKYVLELQKNDLAC